MKQIHFRLTLFLLVAVVLSLTSCVSMLHRYIDRDDLDAVREEIAGGAPIESTDHRDLTPLQLAADQGHLEIAEYLISQGANVNAETSEMSGQVTPLRYAINNNDYLMVKLLIENGADVNQTNVGGWTPLMTAARVGDRQIVDLLLDAGAEIDVRDADGTTPIRIASNNGWTDIVVYLTMKMENS